ncbi:MAG TPA: acetylornithine deacetylase [Alphaproteobacteria bacterium]|nr:acetylornithine deacetylase [Alphaproteobacteria bacterium]
MAGVTAPRTYTPIEMIERLVAFDTTSRNSNLELIDFVAEYLAGHGVKAEIIADEAAAKANLLATIGPARPGGVVLSGHTDVVPIDGQDWQSDPFTVTRREGRLYGRGTADMKSFSAVALALVPEFLARNPKIPIHLALSYDEEVGCLGVRGMVPRLARPELEPLAVIVGEPTNMQLVTAHKGIRTQTTTVRGLEAHSSATHSGVNAVMYAAELIAFLGRLALEAKTTAPPDCPFEPPYTTIHVGTVEGGTAINIIAKECCFRWEFRLIPGDDAEHYFDRFTAFAENEVLPRMREVSADVGIETVASAAVPPCVPEAGSAAETLVMALAGTNRTGVVSYGTEAGLFQQAGMATVICGPGDIAQAHKPDEFISLEQVEACTAFMRRLADYAASA